MNGLMIKYGKRVLFYKVTFFAAIRLYIRAWVNLFLVVVPYVLKLTTFL